MSFIPAPPVSAAERPTSPDPLRRTLGHMATSVTIVTTTHDGTPHGFTANSFAAVSRNPPLVTVFLDESAECYPVFEVAEHVAINVLADGQDHLARAFATRGADKFAIADVDEAHHAPILRDAMATILGAIQERYVVGDHLMLLIAVDDMHYRDREPLVYHNRVFRKLV